MSHHQTSHDDERTCEWYDDGCLLGKHEGSPTVTDCSECGEYKGLSRGLGDTVTKALQKIRIDRFFENKKSEEKKSGCGCGKRRAALNKKFPPKGTT